MSNEPVFSEDLDRNIVEFERWAEKNQSRDVDRYLENHSIPTDLVGAFREHLSLENELFQHRRPSASSNLTGQQIGNYRVVAKLGAGGMGTVWLADQTSPVKRPVALKLLSDEVGASGDLARRLEKEAQVLANLSHPNIAKVLDTGIAENGTPYFAMEFIDGPSITDYCNKNFGAEKKNSLENRLSLFRQVCDAVQHIHQKSLLHRDIKPSNVMVATVDGKPQVKVIDLGLAKVIQTSEIVDLEKTDGTGLVGSPLWMSPEQVVGKMDAGDSEIDTRSDIYSLGALLYELLAGTCPLDGFRSSSSKFELLKAVVDSDFERPSARLSRSIANRSSTTPNENAYPWGSSLKRELDWVVMKALAKDREHRYSSVANLADDVDRFLKNEPVQARAPSLAYHTTKFVKRNKSLIASLGILLLGLTIATIVSARYASIATAQRNVAKAAAETADEQREKAEKERTKAEAAQQRAEEERRFTQSVVETTIKSFGSLDIAKPGVAYDTFKKQFLQLQQENLDELDWSSNREEELAIRQVLAASLSGAGFEDLSILEKEKVANLSEELFGLNYEKTISAKTKYADALIISQDRAAADVVLTQCEQALENTEQVSDQCRLHVELVRAGLSRYPDLEELDLIVAEIKEKVGEDTSLYVSAISKTAYLSSASGYLPKSLKDYETAIVASRNFYGDHRNTMVLQLGYWAVASRLRRTDDAKARKLGEFVSTVRDKFGPKHEFTLRAEETYLDMRFHRRELEDIVGSYEKFIAKHAEVFGENHQKTAALRYEAAKTLRIANNHDAAIKQLEACLPAFAKHYGEKSDLLLNAQYMLSSSHHESGNPEIRNSIIEKYYPIAKEHLGTLNSVTLRFIDISAVQKMEEGNYDEAETILRGGIADARAGSNSIAEANFLWRLSLVCLHSNSKPDLATESIEECIKIRTAVRGRGNFHTQLARVTSLSTALMARDYDSAVAIADELIEELVDGNAAPGRLMARITKAECLVERQAFEDASTLATAVLKEATDGSKNYPALIEIARSKAVIGFCKHAAGEKEASRTLVEEALAEFRAYASRSNAQAAFPLHEDRMTGYMEKMEQ